MKKNIFKISLLAIVGTIAGVNLLSNNNKESFTDLTLQNIDAFGKGIGEDGKLYPGYTEIIRPGAGQANCYGHGFLFCA